VNEGRGETLIARTGELRRLAAAWHRAVAGAPGAVVVAGEAGIGKTRLVRTFAAEVETAGGRVLAGGCLPLGTGDLPYGPFVTAFRGMLREVDPGAVPAILGPNRAELARLVPELRARPDAHGGAGLDAAPRAAEGPSPASSSIDDRYTQARLFEVVLGVVDRLARATPTALVVEDLQWADPSTLDLLAFLVRNLHEAPVLLVVTVRTDELDGRTAVVSHLAELERLATVERIDLGRLDRDDLGRLLAEELGRTVDPGVVDRVWQRTGGNPFFAEQLVAAATETDASRANDFLPPRLRDVVLARVATVSDAGQEVLRVASAAGARIDDGLLADVAELPAQTLRQALHEVTDRRILERSGDGSAAYLVFHHALLREVIHEDLLPAERARLHARFATALEARSGGVSDEGSSARPSPPPSSAELAYHWAAAGDDRRALAPTIEAARAAQRGYAWREANRHYLRALELWERLGPATTGAPADRVELLNRAADTAVLAGETAAAVELGRAAIAAVDPIAEPARAGALQERLRWYLWESGDRAAAAVAVDEAERLIPAEPPSPARSRVLAHRAAIRMGAGRFEESVADAEAAIEIARIVAAPTDEALALGILGWDLALLGRVDEGLARVREAIAIADGLESAEGMALGSTNLAVLLDRIGRPAESLEVAVAGWERARSLGVERTYGGLLLAVAAKAAIALGRWDEAAELLDTGSTRDPGGLAEVRLTIQRLRLATWRGDHATADDARDRLARVADERRSTEDRAAVLAAVAELAAVSGDIPGARSAVDEAFELATDGPPDPALAQLAATGLRVEADAAEAARARHDTIALDTARDRAGRIAARVEAIAAVLGAGRTTAGAGDLGRAGASPAPSRIVAFTVLCRAEAHRVETRDTADEWVGVAAAWEAIGRPFPAAQARYRAASATLRDRGSRTDARAALMAARETAARLHARPLVADIDGLARQARLDLDAAARRSPIGDEAAPDLGLTDRELEILRLIAGGWSNQQIADALFISRKTASVHASNIFDKLGASNRAEAGAIALRIGLVDRPPPPPGSVAAG
jgi:DNA-binding CsgD family transcriptional regulator